MTTAVPAQRPLDEKRLLGAVTFLRREFRNDGAEGESVHLVCNDAIRLLDEVRRLKFPLTSTLTFAEREEIKQCLAYGAPPRFDLAKKLLTVLAGREDDLAKLRTAVLKLDGLDWSHDLKCEHAACVEPKDCADGHVKLDDTLAGDCEAPGVRCSCYVVDVAGAVELARGEVPAIEGP